MATLPTFEYDYRGCPTAWTPHALRRQYARVIRRAEQSGETGVEPIWQLSNFFHQFPGLRVVIGRKMLPFINGDVQSTKLRANHPAVRTFKEKEKAERLIEERRECIEKCESLKYSCVTCCRDLYYLPRQGYRLMTILGALAIPLAIAAILVNSFGLGSSSRAIAGAAGGLQSCMDDVGLGQFCLNNSYQCGGSSSLSSINITSVSSNPNPYCMRFDCQPLSVFNKCNPCIG